QRERARAENDRNKHRHDTPVVLDSVDDGRDRCRAASKGKASQAQRTGTEACVARRNQFAVLRVVMCDVAGCAKSSRVVAFLVLRCNLDGSKVVRYHLDPRPGALLRGSNRVFGAQDRQASRFSAVPVRSSRPVLPAQSLRSLTSHSQATAQGVLSESWGAKHKAEHV